MLYVSHISQFFFFVLHKFVIFTHTAAYTYLQSLPVIYVNKFYRFVGFKFKIVSFFKGEWNIFVLVFVIYLVCWRKISLIFFVNQTLYISGKGFTAQYIWRDDIEEKVYLSGDTLIMQFVIVLRKQSWNIKISMGWIVNVKWTLKWK